MKKRENGNMLYIIKDGGYNYYKIGITNNLRKRFSTLQTGNPVKLRIYKTIQCKDRHTLEKIERLLHTKLAKKHIRGEWYILDRKDLQAIERIETYIELFNYLKD